MDEFWSFFSSLLPFIPKSQSSNNETGGDNPDHPNYQFLLNEGGLCSCPAPGTGFLHQSRPDELLVTQHLLMLVPNAVRGSWHGPNAVCSSCWRPGLGRSGRWSPALIRGDANGKSGEEKSRKNWLRAQSWPEIRTKVWEVFFMFL